ncbi:MAG TPA: hypothetical protein PKZ52_15745, partial [Cellvibrionaceae bacterium]|nr:hypothetical protein [Cellvibrionaceae bacterium]
RQIKHCIQEHKKADTRTSDGKERARRLQQKAETLNKAADRIDEFLANEQPKIGQGKTKKEIKRVTRIDFFIHVTRNPD